MRFGARRRAAGKHAGERAGRRSRSPETTPQGTWSPPTDRTEDVPEPPLVPAVIGARLLDDTAERPAVRAEREDQLQDQLQDQPQDQRRERRRQRRDAAADAQARVAHDVSAFPLTPPSANNGLLAVFQKRYLLKLLVKREISARYQGSFLGMLWSYIGPLCQFFVYWFVMGTILDLHTEVENFGIHVFAGLVVVHFFTETFGAGTRSIVRNKSIVVKLPLPREMFPVASMLVSLFHVFPQMVILTVACLAYGWAPDLVGMAALALGLLIAMLLGTGCALMFSAANVFFRDFSNVVSILQLFVRFSVPMIYPYSLVDDRFGQAAQYYLFNPLADCVLLVQRAVWVGTTSNPSHTEQSDLPPDLLMWGLVMAGVSLVVLVIGQLVFSRLETKIPERL